jgi:GMP synthase (glutamine-hydrolysing)
MKPFLLIQSRPEESVANNEYNAFLKFSGLRPSQLERINIKSGEIPAIDLAKYSGVWMGGSPYTLSEKTKTVEQEKYEQELPKLLQKIIDADFPFLAACAIGSLVKSQGGVVSKIYGEDVGAKVIKLSEEARNDPLFEGLTDGFEAFVGHKEACEVLPPSAVLLASSSTCPVQAFKIKRNVYATQFHPELDQDGLAVRIKAYKHMGYFAPEEADPLVAESLKHSITEPEKLLHNFVKIYQH